MSTIATGESGTASHERAVPAIPLTGTALQRALAFEWTRLKGLRSTWVATAAMAVLSLLNGVLLPTEVVEPKGGGQASLEVASLVNSLQFDPIGMQLPFTAWLLVFVLGTGPVTTEFGHRTARTAWLTVGNRGLSYSAKLLVGAAGALAVSVGGLALSTALGSAALVVAEVPQPDWSAAAGPLLRYLIVMACLPVLAGGLAALVRNRQLAVLALVLWPLLLERIVGLAVERIPGMDGAADWFPFAAARAAMNGARDPDGFTRLLIGSDLAPLTGLGVFCACAAVVAWCGWLVYRQAEAP